MPPILPQPSSRPFSYRIKLTMPHYSSDTRTLQPGDTFVAVRGERTDGHAFLAEAVARGATTLIVEDGADVAAVPQGVAVGEGADTPLHFCPPAPPRPAHQPPGGGAGPRSPGKTPPPTPLPPRA